MDITAFGHALETVHDGLTVFAGGVPAPVPLVDTAISVAITAGLATVSTRRRFRNAEAVPIEALLTLPVGFDAVVTGLRAVVAGRVLLAVAKPKAEARDDYEGALDAGKLAVLHEEVLRGVHALSVGNLAAGAEVEVELTALMPLFPATGGPCLRLPVTVGQLYGASPLAPADDLTTSARVRHMARLTVTSDAGQVVLGGRPITDEVEIALDAAIELQVQGGGFGVHHGIAADGRQVRLDLRAATGGTGALDLAVLVDHSGSTDSRASGPRGLTLWEAMRDGLRLELGRVRATDRIALWQFAARCEALGAATGAAAAGLVQDLSPPAGGTELARAVRAVLRSGAADILVLTDGQTWAHDVDALAASKARISAILVGAGGLDANIGQLCAMTGGQVFYAAGDDVAASLSLALSALRRKGGAVGGELVDGAATRIVAQRGGVEIVADWSGAMDLRPCDAVGRYAAALSLPLFQPDAAEAIARAHGLCTHRTSLILTDAAGAVVEGMAQQRKVPLMSVAASFEERAVSFSSDESWSEMRPMLYEDRQSTASPSPSARLGLLRRLFTRNGSALSVDRGPLVLPVAVDDLCLLFAGVRWDALGADFMQGDCSALSVAQRRIVEEIAAQLSQDRVNAAALDPLAVALGQIADLVGDRLAQRFVRRLFAGVAPEIWHPLRLAGATSPATPARRGS